MILISDLLSAIAKSKSNVLVSNVEIFFVIGIHVTTGLSTLIAADSSTKELTVELIEYNCLKK